MLKEIGKGASEHPSFPFREFKPHLSRLSILLGHSLGSERSEAKRPQLLKDVADMYLADTLGKPTGVWVNNQ